MDLELRGARVLVTGGASNIGRGIVHGFAAEGARLLICDIDGAQAAKTRAEALERGAAQAEVAVVDLALEGAGSAAVERIVADWGGIDVLVNNAGLSLPGFVAQDTDRDGWRRMVDLNLFGAVECTRAALASMRRSGGGSIVFISSDAAFGEIRQGVYGATKAALIALARTVAREHGRDGIRSNVVCPGLVLPESPDAIGTGSLWTTDDQETVFNDRQIEAVRKNVPLQRLTTAADIADAVVWISSERRARQVTGQVLSVGGGYSMP
ncbi:SDR family NAD(P)-dependent oxidoreductase [Streptomyces fuscichromogenes]|uniref:2-hydroxycyclohexanecarboxyl-CoA dehydrogenase n=1 Tax=Streptomyces fuscichromogenes TaxID=1324013 RepID=A0A917XGI5_9ACTN|nr:SDR family oxidoreductase [Streptomyces fuscichromogenes]GGN19794.1 2-hydroxycyclohexanecarboxyl-CoA dehydrogenase [Streptomyces fuscichromogenes]